MEDVQREIIFKNSNCFNSSFSAQFSFLSFSLAGSISLHEGCGEHPGWHCVGGRGVGRVWESWRLTIPGIIAQKVGFDQAKKFIPPPAMADAADGLKIKRATG